VIRVLARNRRITELGRRVALQRPAGPAEGPARARCTGAVTSRSDGPRAGMPGVRFLVRRREPLSQGSARRHVFTERHKLSATHTLSPHADQVEFRDGGTHSYVQANETRSGFRPKGPCLPIARRNLYRHRVSRRVEPGKP